MKGKAVIASSAALLLLGLTTAANAGDRGAGTEDFLVGSLGTSINATDIVSVQCGVGTTAVRADVNDNGGVDGVRLRVTVLDSRGRSASQVSPDDGISPVAILSGGPGQYLVIFQKAAGLAPATVEGYDTIIRCTNSVGAEVVTNVLLVQNQ